MCFFYLILWNIISLGEVTFSSGRLVRELFVPPFNLVRTIGQKRKCWLLFYTQTYSAFHVLGSPSKTPRCSKDPVTFIPRFSGVSGDITGHVLLKGVSWVPLRLKLRSNPLGLTWDPSHAEHFNLNLISTLPRVAIYRVHTAKRGRCAEECVDYILLI